MEIIHFLRSWKTAYLSYRNSLKYKRVSNLVALLDEFPQLESVIVQKEGLVLQLKNKAKFEWDLKKPNSFLIATNENYERLEQELISKLLKPSDIVFDIGANFGYFTVLMKQFCPEIKLYSFEPVKATFQTLLRNLELNQFADVKVYNFGFSNEKAAVTFYIPDQLGDAWASMGTGVSTVFNYKLHEETCEVRKLDDFVVENNINAIDFIKCDVEGAEKLVITGALHAISQFKPTLMLEIGNMWTAAFGYNREILLTLMIDNLGYRCFGVLANELIAINEPVQVIAYPEEKMYNYFFVHPSKTEIMSLMLNQIEKK